MSCLVVCLCLTVAQSASVVATFGGNEACCFSTGFCLDLLPDDCIALGGSPQGPGTDCVSDRCAPAESDCCCVHGTPGCDDEVCEGLVCGVDPFCCDVEWDIQCAVEAIELCGDLCGPEPDCPGPVNDDCSDKLVIFDGVTAFSTSGATTDGGDTNCTGDCCDVGDPMIHNDVWYSYEATCSGTLTVSTCDTVNYDSKIGIYDGCGACPYGGNEIGCNDDGLGCPGFSSLATADVVQGNCYTIRIGAFGATDSGSGTVSITCGSAPQCGVEGDPCDDGNACTEKDTCNANLECEGSPVDCPEDGNPCTDASCDPPTGCGQTPNSEPCDDGDSCTDGDVCSGGSCSGEPFCEPGEVCVDGDCVPAGDCPEGDPCDDGNACTEGSTCDADGNCVGGTPVDCSGAGGECNTASCDPSGAEGNCDDLTPVKNGEPCEAGDACTENDSCSDGECVAEPIDCPPDEVCVAGKCIIPNTWYVEDDGPGGGCTGWGTACPDLQTALSLAIPGDEIWVAQGTYTPSAQSDPKDPRSATFQLLDAVRIYGGFAGVEDSLEERAGLFDQTILTGDLNGDDEPFLCKNDSECDTLGRLCVEGACIIESNNEENSYNLVRANGTDDTAILDGFTITGGNADGEWPFNGGGGMRNFQSNPTVNNCTFSANFAHLGGGMANWFSNLTVNNCTFIGNSAASEGGGMNNFNDSSPTVTNCTFSGNSAPTGGGMNNLGSGTSPTVTHCTFIGNSANNGGGMRSWGSNPTVTNCTFSGNSASVGGGVSNILGSPTVSHCSFIGNSANSGGGMRNFQSNPTVGNCTFSGNVAAVGGGIHNILDSSPGVTNCTFSGNVASADGGGMLSSEAGGIPSNPSVANCIFWANTGGEIVDTGNSETTASYSNIPGGWPGVGNIDADPLFADADLRLLPDSLAIDSGSNAAVPAGITTDLDGEARFVDRLLTPDCPQAEKDPKVDCGIAPIVDMGAYEFGSDCNDNGIPDVCDLSCDAKGGLCNKIPKCGQGSDCNENGIPDECEVPPIGPPENDCNINEIPDDCELEGNDCDGNEVPDECDPDCNDNGTPDACDIDGGGSTDCDGDGVPDECEIPPDGPDENDCNGNGEHDACDILNEASDDCNGNGIPDECEIDENSPAPGGPFFCMKNCDPDCDDNGIPDECDIADCPPGDASCDDCNLNGVPDGCDIADGTSPDNEPPFGVPDECIEFDGECAEGDPGWTCPENWEGDIVPDNSKNATFSVTLAGVEDDVFLDDDITIDTLRILNDATLSVTQAGTGDFTVAAPGGILVEGNLLVANDRVIDVTAGTVTIGPGGIYQADPDAKGPVSAELQAGTITVQGGLLPVGGGSLILSGSMGVIVEGDLQTAEEDDDKGCDAPPDLNSTDNAQVRVMGNLDFGKCVEVNISSSEPVILDGDMQNQSTFPARFDWDAGELRMNGTSQTIEAAGEDRGPWPIGLEDNFVIGTLTVMSGSTTQVVDEFDNQQDGVIACDEALYVGTLIVGPGAVLLTNGCRVYYNELINNGAVPGLGIDVLQIRTPIPADLNGDGKVGPFDLALLLGNWGPCSAPCAPEGEPDTCPESCTPEDHEAICRADISGDCKVGPLDLALLLGNWGPAPE